MQYKKIHTFTIFYDYKGISQSRTGPKICDSQGLPIGSGAVVTAESCVFHTMAIFDQQNRGDATIKVGIDPPTVELCMFSGHIALSLSLAISPCLIGTSLHFLGLRHLTLQSIHIWETHGTSELHHV